MKPPNDLSIKSSQYENRSTYKEGKFRKAVNIDPIDAQGQY